jgi:hypothetical protein
VVLGGVRRDKQDGRVFPQVNPQFIGLFCRVRTGDKLGLLLDIGKYVLIREELDCLFTRIVIKGVLDIRVLYPALVQQFEANIANIRVAAYDLLGGF